MLPSLFRDGVLIILLSWNISQALISSDPFANTTRLADFHILPHLRIANVYSSSAVIEGWQLFSFAMKLQAQAAGNQAPSHIHFDRQGTKLGGGPKRISTVLRKP